MNDLIVSSLDYVRIQKQINEAKLKKTIDAVEAEKLVNELNSATIEWMVPGGLTKIKIDEIIYQPEAAGDYTL